MSSNKYADLIINMYSSLQQNIFNIIINALKNSKYQNINKDNIMQWQLEQFAKAGKLTDQVINEVAKVNNETPAAIKEMCQQLGYGTVKATQSEIKRNTTKAGNLSPDSKGIINSYINQTWKSLYNNVNESLLTRNTVLNSAGQIYRDIVTKSTLEVTSGLKTHEQAIRDNVYRWVDRGVPTRLTDKAGRGWSLEGYARTVINTTNHQVINDLRNQTMNVNKVTLAKMSWHSCARPVCAPIQGHIVNMVPPEDSEYDSKYDSIYNHGYGKPSGVQGINCGHIFTPWDPEVNIDHKDPDMPTPKQAMKQSEVQQQQRSIERAIRQTKKKMNAAEMLGDKAGMNHFKSVLSNQQARLRDLVGSNKFLSRDYAREQVANDHKLLKPKTGKAMTKQKGTSPAIKSVEDFKNAVQKLGVENVDIKGIAPDKLHKVYKTIKQTYDEVPAVKNFISSIESSTSKQMGDAVAKFGVNYDPNENKIVPKLILNSSEIEHFDNTLKTEMKQHFWVKHSDFSGIVKHELAHAISARKSLDDSVLKSLKLPENSNSYLKSFVRHGKSGAFEKRVLKKAFKKSNIEMNDDNIAKYISYYGKTNYKEAFAEAYSNEDKNNPITANLKKLLLDEMKNLKPVK